MGKASVKTPANGLKYQAAPIQNIKAALAERVTCSSFFSRLRSGSPASTPVCDSVVATTPTTMTIAALVSEFSRAGCGGAMDAAVILVDPPDYSLTVAAFLHGGKGHCQSKFYTGLSAYRGMSGTTVLAEESPLRAARFDAENQLYSVTLTVPPRVLHPLAADLAGEHAASPSICLPMARTFSAKPSPRRRRPGPGSGTTPWILVRSPVARPWLGPTTSWR